MILKKRFPVKMRNKWHHKFQEMDILTCSLQVAFEDKKDDIRLYKHMPQCNRKGEMVLGKTTFLLGGRKNNR